ncbi:hypothetical protein A8926_6862 [Saccharopolyspora spinosa]|uniref:Uncharacterized protein n=1 Tax=Saccharopolyspora spinosa TaxID=60894 RepID=A0A2N3Y797_SACSN|nr:hypothetical protein A8926_6862 [Saccharopolyspora spinosa]
MDAKACKEVRCTDAKGRSQVLRILPLAHDRVAVQPPPSDWFEVNAEQLRDLLAAAREAIWESHANYDPTNRTTVVGGTCF